MIIEGFIKRINPVEQITPTFSKCEVVILTDEMYPQTIAVQFANTRIALLESFSEGQRVSISINLQGREWQDPKTGDVRYFTSVVGWRIEASAPGMAQRQPSAAPANPFASQGMQAQSQAPVSQSAPAGDDDDLPF